jgi:formamidopyrimidine-DNA glycosylase
MPELPEVEMARRYLEATSLCKTIKMARVNDDRILSGVSAGLLEQSLVGQQFHSAYRHGKRLFLSLKEDLWLTLHLGLTGRLNYLQSVEDEPGHTRLLIIFENNCRLAFEDMRIFGEVGITRSPQSFLKERSIGPDALEIDLKDFLKIMRDRKGIIKSALLNQSLGRRFRKSLRGRGPLPGGHLPKSRSLSEARLKALFSAIRETLLASLSAQANLGELPDSYLLPHRYPGEICPRDGAPLRHEKIAGRTSYYCPKHQK